MLRPGIGSVEEKGLQRGTMKIKKEAPFTTYAISISGEYGALEGVYYPDNALDELERFFYYFDDADKYLSHAASLLKEQITRKLDESLMEVLAEIEELTLRQVDNLSVAKAKEKTKRIRLLIEKARRERIPPPVRGGSESDYDLSELANRYETVYPQWKDAKEIYKQNKKRKNWQDMVKAAHPLPPKPNDLIERLAKHPNLPDGIRERIDEKGFNNTPSHIALEHAARLCGVPPWHYTFRHLQRQRNALKKSDETLSEK
jgi:hypothetical protein